MKVTLFRITSVSLLLALCLMPLYAHHGNQFLTKAMQGNAAEVQLAEMAMTKSQNQRVKDFAQMLSKDHSMALDKMHMLMEERKTQNIGKADTRTQTRTGQQDRHEMKMTPANQRTYDRLSKMSGANFDREYINLMVRKHRESIREFETHARSHGTTASNRQDTGRQKPTADPDDTNVDHARDTDTVAFAREILPTLRQHLQQAQDIQKEIRGGTPISAK